MSNAVYPILQGLTYDIEKKALWNTIIQTSASGKEKRATNRIYPQYEFNLTYSFLEDLGTEIDDIHTLIGFYNARKGSYDDFLFKDDTDYEITDQVIASSVNGTDTVFQIVRTYGGFVEPVKGVKVSSLEVKVNDSVVSNYTINDYGVITFSTPPVAGSNIKVSCEFYYRVRFREDKNTFNFFTHGLWDSEVSLITVL